MSEYRFTKLTVGKDLKNGVEVKTDSGEHIACLESAVVETVCGDEPMLILRIVYPGFAVEGFDANELK
jgi:hypothetical protein